MGSRPPLCEQDTLRAVISARSTLRRWQRQEGIRKNITAGKIRLVLAVVEENTGKSIALKVRKTPDFLAHPAFLVDIGEKSNR